MSLHYRPCQGIVVLEIVPRCPGPPSVGCLCSSHLLQNQAVSSGILSYPAGPRSNTHCHGWTLVDLPPIGMKQEELGRGPAWYGPYPSLLQYPLQCFGQPSKGVPLHYIHHGRPHPPCPQMPPWINNKVLGSGCRIIQFQCVQTLNEEPIDMISFIRAFSAV